MDYVRANDLIRRDCDLLNRDCELPAMFKVRANDLIRRDCDESMGCYLDHEVSMSPSK